MATSSPRFLDAPHGLRDEPSEVCLRAPRLREGIVGRTALVNRLRADKAPVVLLTAPAGYGKTTLIASWSKRDPRRFAWLSLMPGDDNPRVLLRSLVESVHRAVPVDAEVLESLTPSLPSARTIVRRLGRWLLAQPDPLVIVIDNVDEISTPECVDVLTTLCDHLLPGSQIVLSGRSPPSLPFARFRVAGRLSELTVGDLMLSDREAAAMLHNVGLNLPVSEIRELNEHAEGWPTGLYLSAIALKTRRGKPRSPRGVSGAHHFVAEYFETEVLERLERKDATFAVEAALLDRMSGPICDAVLGADGSGDRLRTLELADAFVVPLDREHESFRFHRFFREMLRNRLEQRRPARYVELSRRAADWYEHAGDLAAAIRHLRAIDDDAQSARLLGAAAPSVFGGSLLEAIEPFLFALGDEKLLLEHRGAGVVGAMTHALLGHPADAARWASVAERAREDEPAGEEPPGSISWLSILRAAFCRDGIERMGDDAVAALEQVAPHSSPSAFALLLLGVSQLLRGDEQAAQATFADALEHARAAEATLVLSMALAELSLIAQADGYWRQAEELARDARDLVGELDDSAACALPHVASARSALRQNNWVRAADDIERIHALLPRLTDALPWLAVQVRVELAHAHRALNDVDTVLHLVDEVDHLLASRPNLGTLRAAAHELREDVQHQEPHTRASLTRAELRLLPLLTTHLTFRQIAEHLYVSRNTIKTQAISVYRKLGVSSRTEAIDRALELGLLRPGGEVIEHIA
jgi:LuxR family transcriptional regulator, maltose regulon positive regulatory protein